MTVTHRRRERSPGLPMMVLVGLLTIVEMLPVDAQERSARETAGAARRALLSAGQIQALCRLRLVCPAKPAPLFLFTDPNKDPDDLSVLVQTKELQRHGFVDLRCVVTTLGDVETRTTRAKFVRGVLDDLGLRHVPVGVGLDYSIEVRDAAGAVDAKATAGRMHDHKVFLATPLLRQQAVVEPEGLGLLKRELAKVPDHSAVVLIIAGMADPAALLREAPELVRQKVARVVIMGGVEPRLDQRGFVVADQRAYNNTTDQASANYTYARVQELELPLVVVSKEAAYRAAVPRVFYEGMAATGHPIGVYLESQQRQSLRQLWTGIHQGHLPPALTPEWFFRTFTDIDLESASGKAALAHAKIHADDFDAIWKEVSKFNLYDPLALLAATPGANELAYRGEVPQGARGNVQIISKNSIKDASLMKDLLAGLAIASLSPPVPRKSRVQTAPGYPPRQHVDEADAPWAQAFAGYAPPEYTDDKVLKHEGQWADPPNVNDVKRVFLTRTPAGDVAVTRDDQGRPLNPLGRTGLRGRGLLGRWGRNQAGDPLLTRVHPQTGRLQLLVIERKDSGKKALPGGMVDEGEEIAATVARELSEETGARLSFAGAALLFTGVVDDPRNTDNAWLETTVLHKHLTDDEQRAMQLRAGDDARAVSWVDIDPQLLATMYASHSDYVRLALARLQQDPAFAPLVQELLARDAKSGTAHQR